MQGGHVLVHRGDRELEGGRDLLIAVPARDRLRDRPLGTGEPGVIRGQRSGRDADGVAAADRARVVQPERRLGAQRHPAAVAVGGVEPPRLLSGTGQVADQRLQRDRDLRPDGVGGEQADPALPRRAHRHQPAALVEDRLAQGRPVRGNGGRPG